MKALIVVAAMLMLGFMAVKSTNTDFGAENDWAEYLGGAKRK